jgi:hypothetical protein
MLIVLDCRFTAQDACIIFAAVRIILQKHRVDPRLVPGLVRMLQKRTQGHPADLDTAGCCAVYLVVLRVCCTEQLTLVAEGLIEYALVHLRMRVGAAPGDVLRVIVCMLHRLQRARARILVNKQQLLQLFAALAELANTWTQQLCSSGSRAINRYMLLDALTSLLRMGHTYPQEQLLHAQGLCVGMLTLRPCITLLVKVKHLLANLCAAEQCQCVNKFLLKETLVARLLRINTRDARIRREVLEMLSYIIDCNGQQCLCTNFTEGVCHQVLLYCINTTPIAEASALCAYRNAAIVSTIVKSAAHGLHKRCAHSATRTQTLAFFAQLPRAVCDDLGLQPHLVPLL